MRAEARWVRELLAKGIARSQAFASEVQQLADSDVIVIVEPAAVPRGTAGYLALVHSTATRRYVRIRFDNQLISTMAIAVIGHELRHAVEIATHPEVVDNATLRAMYARIGQPGAAMPHGRESYDSVEAQAAGRTIMAELLTLETSTDDEPTTR